MPQCTAKSKRTGQRCRRPAVSGKKVCYHHGGKSPGPPPGARRALKHGIYSRTLSDEERALLPYIDTGPNSLDDLIRLVKVLLSRDLKKQRRAEENELAALELREATRQTRQNPRGAVDEVTVRLKRPDYFAIIERWAGRIGSLTAIRAALTREKREDAGNLDELMTALDRSRAQHRSGGA